MGVHDEDEQHVEAEQQCQLPQYVVVETIRMLEAMLHMAGARLPVILSLPWTAPVAAHVPAAAAAVDNTKIEAGCQHRVGVDRLHNVLLQPQPLQIAVSTVLPLPRLPAVADSPSLAEVELLCLSLQRVALELDVWIVVVAVAVVIDLVVVVGVDRVLFETVESGDTVGRHRLLATTVDEVADGTKLPDALGLGLAGVVAVADVVVLVAVLVVVLGLVKAATVSVLLYHPIGP